VAGRSLLYEFLVAWVARPPGPRARGRGPQPSARTGKALASNPGGEHANGGRWAKAKGGSPTKCNTRRPVRRQARRSGATTGGRDHCPEPVQPQLPLRRGARRIILCSQGGCRRLSERGGENTGLSGNSCDQRCPKSRSVSATWLD